MGVGSVRPSALLGFRWRNPSYQKAAVVVLAGCLSVVAAPVWKAPAQLKLGELTVLELREEDPSKPSFPRPTVEDRLGPLHLRSMEPLPDGRGWRFQVQALEPGLAMIPALDLGNQQRGPELRLWIPRSIPYGDPWMGFGGGNEDRLPTLPFPWAWASLLLVAPLGLIVWAIFLWRKGSAGRYLRHALQAFQKQWPPEDRERGKLDAAHGLGRDLLAARFGEAARAWGPADFQARGLGPWALWAKSLDAARFGQTEPPFPSSELLVTALDARTGERAAR
jgi:hypothetical protein